MACATEALAAHLASEGCTLHSCVTPARAARCAAPSVPLPPLLAAALAAAGVARLYAHQAAALDALSAGFASGAAAFVTGKLGELRFYRRFLDEVAAIEDDLAERDAQH